MGRPRGAGGNPPIGDTNEEDLSRHDLAFTEPDSLRRDDLRSLALDAGFFADYALSIKLITERLPARSTARQAYAFLLIVSANAMGQSVTAKSLRDVGGVGPNGEEVLGQAIQKTYQVLLDASEYDEDGVGWVQLEMDRSDRRQKHLVLTEKGLRIALEIRKIIKGNNHL